MKEIRTTGASHQSFWVLEIQSCKLFQTAKEISDQCVRHAVNENQSTPRKTNPSLEESGSLEENRGVKFSHKGSVDFISTLLWMSHSQHQVAMGEGGEMPGIPC